MTNGAKLLPCPYGDECPFLRRLFLYPESEDPRDPRDAHDFLLSIETADPLLAAQFIASVIADTSTGAGSSFNLHALTNDPGDFPRFIQTHNWRNPDLMVSIGELVQNAMEQAWASDERQASRTYYLDRYHERESRGAA